MSGVDRSAAAVAFRVGRALELGRGAATRRAPGLAGPPRVDMAPEAVAVRLRRVAELRRLAGALARG